MTDFMIAPPGHTQPPQTGPALPAHEIQRRNARMAARLFGVAGLMIAVAFAFVPLYRLFCQVTGLAGTTQEAEAAPGAAPGARVIAVRFDANTDPDLPWTFKPVQNEVLVRLGEEGLAFYEATNTSDRPIQGHATFNVTPLKTGQYFVKIACFCFEDQTLMPGETVHMPVQFYVDPAFAENDSVNEVQTITLSYTFFRTIDDKQAVVVPDATTATGG